MDDIDPAVSCWLFLLAFLLSLVAALAEFYYLSTNQVKLDNAVRQNYSSARLLQKVRLRKLVLLSDTIWLAKIATLTFLGFSAIHFIQGLFVNFLTIQLFVAVVVFVAASNLLMILPPVLQRWLKRQKQGQLFYSLQLSIYFILLVPVFFLLGIIRCLLHRAGSKSAFVPLIFPLLGKTISNGNGQDIEPEPETEVVLLQNALDFSKVKVRDCVIPRTEMVSLPVESSLETLSNKFIETRFSKILIYAETSDNIIGYVHSHDLFKKPNSIKSILLPVFVVPETMNAQELFELFVKEKRSIAIVVDEFGGTEGMVTIEDVIEEIFGEIDDEHDTDDYKEDELGNNEFLFSGRLEIDYLNDKYGLNIPESENYDTLAGFVLDQLEEIPQANACLETEQFLITVQRVTDTRIELIELKVKD